ncbi:MAG: anthranilate synthase component I [Acidimicrobiia bacterium]
MNTKSYKCKSAPVTINVSVNETTSDKVNSTINELKNYRGFMLTSRYEYPGRYTRWDIATFCPPIVIEGQGNEISIKSLNMRGTLLLDAFSSVLSQIDFLEKTISSSECLKYFIAESSSNFMEEDRSKMAHIMNVVRHLRDAFYVDEPYIGFYGAFGYDLGIDFMGVKRAQPRSGDRDLVLYFVDQLYITDHANNSSFVIDYDFQIDIDANIKSTELIERTGDLSQYKPAEISPSRDMRPGEYSEVVDVAKEYFARGDLFEVVPSQVFSEPCAANPVDVFEKLLQVNPAPYGAIINLGENEWTVSASPEMYVRAEGKRVESCPIAGTIARGSGDITDEDQIRTLLESEKEKSELTMCTDVDRNDKSRVCIPSTIDVIGRRQIEIYSRLIHTVDHVEGYLEDGYDSIDAFLTHMWAVTVTGAPKMWAMNFIEKYEKSPRRFYGGAMGYIGLNGSLNTGLMLRTIHFHSGSAHIRVGATLLADSDPQMEEKETELKASAMLDVVRHCHDVASGGDGRDYVLTIPKAHDLVLTDKEDSENISKEEIHSKHSLDSEARVDMPKVLLVDCEDSFVHTLAGYFRMCGAVVHTKRIGFSMEEFQKEIDTINPDLLCLSPGPGSPTDFGLSQIIDISIKNSLPIFGVCLGLQALVEYFGGTLSQLEEPVHGKASVIVLESDSGKIFADIEENFEAGRYHSLYANENTFPFTELKITARTELDHVIMAVEHVSKSIAAVQFHPESIMTFDNNSGHKIIQNVLDSLAK